MAAFGEVNTATVLIREIGVGGTALGKGFTTPDDILIGLAPTLRFNRNAETANGNYDLPVDMDKTVNPEIRIVWAIETAETDADTLKVDVDYTAYEIAGREADAAATSVTVTTTVTTANGLDAGDVYESVLTLDAGDATNPLSGAQGIGFELNFPTVEDGAGFVSSALVLSVHLHYTAKY